ncbi:MAG: putative protease YhbU precursor [Alphaproteobacteria bacterium ADurb.Bin438]|nr:MAG: putative protease YhbU precursor [Alphaproteobacteria bacterium ADurb.Bin438]
MKKPELLLPAGSTERLKSAILYGADAVYAGLPGFSLRSTENAEIDFSDIKANVEYVHAHGKKIYLTLNLFAKDKEFENLPKLLDIVKEIKPDGLLIADPGVFHFVKEYGIETPLFVSTQANVCSSHSVKFWQKMGASLCVMARELSYDDIKIIRQECPDMKLEMFVHGAMCISYSGRCLISAFMANRSANRGKCAHSCRWHYKAHLIEDERADETYVMEEDEHGSYLMNSKDMNLMPFIEKVLDLELDTLKIEGRNKSEFYVSTVARAYRQAIDNYMNNGKDFDTTPYLEELNTLHNRSYTDGFFNGAPNQNAQKYEHTRSSSDYLYAGFIKEVKEDGFVFFVKNKLFKNDEITFLCPKSLKNVILCLKTIRITGKKQNDDAMEVSPSPQGSEIFIKYSDFNEDVKELLPELSVARKVRNY